VHDLARAKTEDVMQAWAGLGYYSRARNLHACAKAVVQLHHGRFPSAEPDLLALPGIGPYTAAAIRAIAFDQPAIVIDGNVERVIARLLALPQPKKSAYAQIRAAVETIAPKKRSGDFAQAMMDLGAMICTPRSPSCTRCPWRLGCAAFAQGRAEAFPVKAPKSARPQRLGAVFVLRDRRAQVLVRRRPPKGLLGGMDDFPSSDWTQANAKDLSLAQAPFDADWHHVGDVEHVFSHFALRLRVYCADRVTRRARPELKAPSYRWVDGAVVAQQALPSLMQKVWQRAQGFFDQQDER
jgi:A/G-specific adenine glycosylase